MKGGELSWEMLAQMAAAWQSLGQEKEWKADPAVGTASQERPARRMAAALASQALLLSFQLLVSAPHYISAVSPLV